MKARKPSSPLWTARNIPKVLLKPLPRLETTSISYQVLALQLCKELPSEWTSDNSEVDAHLWDRMQPASKRCCVRSLSTNSDGWNRSEMVWGLQKVEGWRLWQTIQAQTKNTVKYKILRCCTRFTILAISDSLPHPCFASKHCTWKKISCEVK